MASPIGIIDEGPWPHDKWLHRPEMNRKMNDFIQRVLQQGLLTLWQIPWPWQPNLAKSAGMKRWLVSSVDQQTGAVCAPLSTPRTITPGSEVTAGAKITQPRGEQAWLRASYRGWKTLLHHWICARLHNLWKGRGQENMCSQGKWSPGWLCGRGHCCPRQNTQPPTGFSSAFTQHAVTQPRGSKCWWGGIQWACDSPSVLQAKMMLVHDGQNISVKGLGGFFIRSYGSATMSPRGFVFVYLFIHIEHFL